MHNSPHVLLSGTGADRFAVEQNLDTVPESYFITDRRLRDLKRVQQLETDKKITLNSSEQLYFKNQRYGTVGCVALDLNGNLAAGTSTGGMTNKKWGRIGDAPSNGLSITLERAGFELGRLKTGTPARLDGKTINWSVLEEQAGDDVPVPFSFLTKEISSSPSGEP